jgi:hypothetical protein
MEEKAFFLLYFSKSASHIMRHYFITQVGGNLDQIYPYQIQFSHLIH